MIEGMFDSGAMPVLERLVQFTSARHGVLVDNIANLSTPNYRPRDIDPVAFQSKLQKAIEQRRRGATPGTGPLNLSDGDGMRFEKDRIELRPRDTNENMLFHDRNNRDLERIMQDLAENTLTHNAGIELLRNEFDMLKMAIREQM